MQTGANLIIEKLKQHGIKAVFEYPGGNIAPMLDELKLDGGIDIILTRNDQAASLMADAYSRATQSVGVCMATVGPGATNLITGIANAYCDSIPIVAITGQVGTGSLKRDRKIRQMGFQEADIVNMVKPVTKWAYMVEKIEELPEVLDKAFHLAKSGRPGPVLIDIPMDVQRGSMDFKKNHFKSDEREPNISYDKMYEFIKLIKESENPIILAGGGILHSNAAKEFSSFVKKTNIPVASSLMGLGSFDMSHPLSVGFFGCYGARYVNKSISAADLVISFGARLDIRQIGTDASKFSANRKIIQVDIDEHEVGIRFKPFLHIHSDIKLFLDKINSFIAGEDFEKKEQWLEKIERYKAENSLEKEYGLVFPYEKVRPQYIIKKINELTTPDDIITTDVGQNQMWTAQFYSYKKPYTNITSGGLGNMGYGLPAAIAAKKANPNVQVINITGDGSFQMNVQELATSRHYDIPVKIVILNNGVLGMVKQFQDKTFPGKATSTHLEYNPDFCKIASAYGFKSYKIENPDEIDSKLKAFMKYKGSAICECVIDSEELAMPEIEGGHGMDDQYPYNKEDSGNV